MTILYAICIFIAWAGAQKPYPAPIVARYRAPRRRVAHGQGLLARRQLAWVWEPSTEPVLYPHWTGIPTTPQWTAANHGS